jgi:hypothetical protein
MNQDLPVAGHKFYVVARGRTPGILPTGKAWVRPIVSMSPMEELLSTCGDATAWPSKQMARNKEISSSLTRTSRISDLEPSPRTKRRKSRKQLPQLYTGTYVQIANPEHAGADPSVGKPEQLCQYVH